MMKGKAKLIITIIAAIAVLAYAGGAVIAYLSDHDEASNPVTVGSNTIEIDEEFEPPAELEPGTVYAKSPKVVNTGDMDCYVRMSVHYSNEEASQFTSIDFNTTDWQFNPDDAYYYYLYVLAPGETTIPLFTTVTTLTQIDNGDGTFTPVTPEDLIDYEIIVYAESVQAADFDNPWDAWAEFGVYVP